MNVDGSLFCTNSTFMKGKEILRLYKDSKQTNLYKAKKIQKNLKKNKQTNKTKAFSIYPDIFIIQKHRYNYLFCATKSEKVLLKISTKYMLYFLKIKKKETRSHIKYKVNFLRFLFLISVGLSFHNKFVG